MIQKAEVFTGRDGQIVFLPRGFQFKGTEVLVRRDPDTGDVILSEKSQSWNDFFAARDAAIAAGEVSDELIDLEERRRTTPPPDPVA